MGFFVLAMDARKVARYHCQMKKETLPEHYYRDDGSVMLRIGRHQWVSLVAAGEIKATDARCAPIKPRKKWKKIRA